MTAKTLKAITWNLHYQSGFDPCDIPDWVVEEIVTADTDIAILTEFSTDPQAREKFVRAMGNQGYRCVASDNRMGNDVLIAVKRRYPVVHVAWTACYGKDYIPENLRVDIDAGEENKPKVIAIFGARIKEVRSYNHAALRQSKQVDVDQAEKRLAECQALFDWTVGLERVILGGDFNTYRTKTCVQQWNGHVLQKLADALGFQMVCPEHGNSVFAEHDPRAFRYDRFLVKGLTAIGEPTYDRSFVARAPHIYQGPNLIGILPGFPDHAILRTEFELN